MVTVPEVIKFQDKFVLPAVGTNYSLYCGRSLRQENVYRSKNRTVQMTHLCLCTLIDGVMSHYRALKYDLTWGPEPFNLILLFCLRQ